MFFLFLVTAFWHALAAYFFLGQPRQTLQTLTHEQPVSVIAIDVVRFLRSINIGYLLLAGWGVLLADPRPELNLILSVANGSQFAVDLYAHRSGRWRQKLLGITLTNGLFMLAHALVFAYFSRFLNHGL